MKSVLRFAAVTLLLAVLACMVTNRAGDPGLYPPTAANTGWRIHLADHGYHAGIVVARDDIAAVAASGELPALAEVARRFGGYRYLEIGWGDEGFYRGQIGFDVSSAKIAFAALSGADGRTVMHVVGLDREPATVFVHSHVVAIDLSRQGSANLAAYLNATFALSPTGSAIELGPGIYGPSLFYRAVPAYSLVNTCNHWVATGLNRAGLGVSMFAATTSLGLRSELAWRAALQTANPIPAIAGSAADHQSRLRLSGRRRIPSPPAGYGMHTGDSLGSQYVIQGLQGDSEVCHGRCFGV